MMFLQFFTWGAWFATLGQCLGEAGLSGIIGDAYQSAPIAAILAPLFLGFIADRFFPSQIVMAVLFLVGGVLLLIVPGFAAAESSRTLVWIITAHMLCYMPTLGLGNSIAFANLEDPNDFPKVRVWGTIGWIVAGLLVGALGWSASFDIFRLAGASSILLGLFCFVLPHTPPPAAGKPVNLRSLLMLDALRLLKEPAFFIFILCSTLVCIPLAYYYSYTSTFLGQLGFDAPAATMTLGQMSEFFFMLLIPFFFRHLGVKWMIAVGMAAWALRYVLFAFGASQQIIPLVLLAILLHGVCYDFFFVTGFMYAEQKGTAEVRGQVQSMLVFFTQGVGMYIGYWFAGAKFGKDVASYPKLNEALTENASAEPMSFFESLTNMFSVRSLSDIDQSLLTETMSQWKTFWMLPAFMAVGILVLFILLFHQRPSANEETATPKENGESR